MSEETAAPVENFAKLNKAILALVIAMLLGLTLHGVELFQKLEGQDFWGWLKALGFALAIECANALSLHILFSYYTPNWYARSCSAIVGIICLGTSYLLQYDYFAGKAGAFAVFYAAVLPGLVTLLSGLSGMLSWPKKVKAPKAAQQPAEPAQPQIDIVQLFKDASEGLNSQMESRFAQIEQQLSSMLATIPAHIDSALAAAKIEMRGELETALADNVSKLVQSQQSQQRHQVEPTRPAPSPAPRMLKASAAIETSGSEAWKEKALELRQRSPEMSVSAIASEVGKSRSTVDDFLRRLA